jgi:hypothetical protein
MRERPHIEDRRVLAERVGEILARGSFRLVDFNFGHGIG